MQGWDFRVLGFYLLALQCAINALALTLSVALHVPAAINTPTLRAGWHSVTPNIHGSCWRNGASADADMIKRAAAAGIDMLGMNDDLLGFGNETFDDDEDDIAMNAGANAFNQRTQVSPFPLLFCLPV